MQFLLSKTSSFLTAKCSMLIIAYEQEPSINTEKNSIKVGRTVLAVKKIIVN